MRSAIGPWLRWALAGILLLALPPLPGRAATASASGQIAFLLYRSGGADPFQDDLALADLATGDLRLLSRSGRVLDFGWAPDGRSLAYLDTALDPVPATLLHLVDLEAGEERVLARAAGTGAIWALLWTADGSGIVVVGRGELATAAGATASIVLLDRASGEERVLETIEEGQVAPLGWRADGSLLLGHRLGGRGQDVVALPAPGAGEAARQLVLRLPPGQRLALSPDGRWLAAFAGRELTLYDAMAGSARASLTAPAPITAVAWRADGAQLALCWRSDATPSAAGAASCALADPDLRVPLPLPAGVGAPLPWTLALSPDGALLAGVVAGQGAVVGELAVMEVASGAVRGLGVQGVRPAWRPAAGGMAVIPPLQVEGGSPCARPCTPASGAQGFARGQRGNARGIGFDPAGVWQGKGLGSRSRE